MRGWGVIFMLIAAAAVVLPDPLGRYLVIVMGVVFVVCMVSDYADRKVQRELDAAAETSGHRKWTAEMRALPDAPWEQALDAVTVDGRPLGRIALPLELREISPRVPRQRRPSQAS